MNNTGAERTGNTAYRDPTGYLFGGSLGACAFALVLYFPLFGVLDEHWHQFIREPYPEPFGVFNGWLMLNSLAKSNAFFNSILESDLLVIVDFFIRLAVPVFVSFSLTWLLLRNDIRPQKTELLERGKVVESNEKAFKKTVAAKLKTADGIRIHADVRVPRDRESEHILIAGATGAGKSQALTHIISSVRERKDKSIIFDIKGDYTAQMVSADPAERKAAQVYLVAPWDERSIQWDIAADIKNKATARDFTEAFIPKTGNESNSYFIEAAQDVLSGCLQFLYTTKQQQWGWKDLQVLLSSAEKISKALGLISHTGAQHIQFKDGAVSPQTQGVMGTLRAPLVSLDEIAEHWSEIGGKSLVSEFMEDAQVGGTLILGARPDQQSVAKPLIAGLLALLMTKGRGLKESKTRRIWFITDELGALPKISSLVDFITLARSKGVCLVAGIQDLGRLHSKYGRDETTTIASQFGTHLIGRLGDNDTAKWAAELFGQQRIERLQISESQQNAVAGLSYQPSVSTTWQQTDKAALLDADFLHLNKATAKGFYMWCRLTDENGAALLGKLHYEINPVPAPFPACVEKVPPSTKPVTAPASSIKKANGILAIIDKKTQKQPAKVNSRQALYERRLEAAKKHGNKDEIEQAQSELDALIENKNNDGKDIQKDADKELEADGIGTEISKEAMSAIVPGIDILMEVSEALGGEVTNEGAGQTQQQSKKKKRKFRFKRENSIDGGME